MKRLTYNLTGWALTPVHIGDGTVWTPEGYKLSKSGNRDVLQRFDISSVISAMPPEKLEQYMTALNKPNGLKSSQDFIQKAVDVEQIREVIQVSHASLEELEKTLSNPLRSGDLKPFVRSGGSPYLPGSSLKGVMRTAWLAGEASKNQELQKRIAKEATRSIVGKTGKCSDDPQTSTLDYSKDKTEQDPLSDLLVGDATFSDNPTLIDRVQVANRTKDGPIDINGQTKGMQIHVERLVSIADGSEYSPTSITCTIAMPDHAGAKLRVNFAKDRATGDKRAIPRHVIHVETLRSATNTHHAKLWMMERKTFYQGTGTDTLMDDILKGFGLPISDPTELASELDLKGAWLIKVGRYAHFKSKTVDGLRFGEKRSKGKRGKDDFKEASFMHVSGGSRTLASRNDGIPLPFGWVLLFDKDLAPIGAPSLKLGPKTTNIAKPILKSYQSNVSPPPIPTSSLAHNTNSQKVKRSKIKMVKPRHVLKMYH